MQFLLESLSLTLDEDLYHSYVFEYDPFLQIKYSGERNRHNYNNKRNTC